MTQTCLGVTFLSCTNYKKQQQQQFFDKHHNTMMLWTCMIITWSII